MKSSSKTVKTTMKGLAKGSARTNKMEYKRTRIVVSFDALNPFEGILARAYSSGQFFQVGDHKFARGADIVRELALVGLKRVLSRAQIDAETDGLFEQFEPPPAQEGDPEKEPIRKKLTSRKE